MSSHWIVYTACERSAKMICELLSETYPDLGSFGYVPRVKTGYSIRIETDIHILPANLGVMRAFTRGAYAAWKRWSAG